MKKSYRIAIPLSLAILMTSCASFNPKQQQPEAVRYINPATTGTKKVNKIPTLQSGQKLTIMNWNIQFFAGNFDNAFAFEGGKDPWPSKNRVIAILNQSANVINKHHPDILLLQEVTKDNVMTARINQIKQLVHRLNSSYKNYTCSYYLKNKFTPHPKYLGPTDLLMCTFSKYKIKQATRYQLPSTLNVSKIVQRYKYKRAILATELPINNGKYLYVLNTHFSAFAQGTDTASRQAKMTYDLFNNLQNNKQLGIIAGDFNQLSNPILRRYINKEDQYYYSKEKTPLAPYFSTFQAAPSLNQTMGKYKKNYFTASSTLQKNKKFNRTIDYFFLTRRLTLKKFAVLKKGNETISDHLPMIIEVKIPKNKIKRIKK